MIEQSSKKEKKMSQQVKYQHFMIFFFFRGGLGGALVFQNLLTGISYLFSFFIILTNKHYLNAYKYICALINFLISSATFRTWQATDLS